MHLRKTFFRRAPPYALPIKMCSSEFPKCLFLYLNTFLDVHISHIYRNSILLLFRKSCIIELWRSYAERPLESFLSPTSMGHWDPLETPWSLDCRQKWGTLSLCFRQLSASLQLSSPASVIPVVLFQWFKSMNGARIMSAETLSASPRTNLFWVPAGCWGKGKI